MSWTDEKKDQVKDLWAKGWSASMIALELGGVTRNAVIGCVHRMQLPERFLPKINRPRSRKRRQPATLTPRPVGGGRDLVSVPTRASKPKIQFLPDNIETPTCEPVTMMDLDDHHCRWPIGEANGAETKFCGAKKVQDGGSWYCWYHRRRSFGLGTLSERDAA